MVAGMWVSKNWHPDFYATLEQQGIPLDLGKTVAVMGVFLILWPIMNTFFIKPLNEAIDDRTRSLEQTFSEAETLRTDMTSLRSDYDRRLAATEAEAREQIQAQIREAQNLRQTLMAEASAKADELVSRAQQEIESEKAKVIVELRTSVVDMSLAAAEKVVGENMDNDRNRRLVQEFIDRVEVAK
ncbi:MAG: ATP synthase subunit b, sodium ion specific [Fimbriimonadaceae bacterium]|nr:ATP synthase subunit b, sodium ion specific [Fimbriimonadaceae bacterium]